MAHRDRARPPAMVAAMRYIRPHRDNVNVEYQYLASCDVHDKVHRSKITRERKPVLHELKDGEPR
jgi:hypothetical protein